MIKIECKTLSVCFEDTICVSSVEIFPPFTTKTFKDGFSVFGADGKSFYIPDNTTYTINGTPKTYEEVVSELPLCLSAITGNNEVQCFADLASFPLVGEDCVLYLDEATNTLYRWDGAAYVQISESKAYETIVAADGSGDYLLLSAALSAGATSIWIKDGNYIETSSPTITNDYTSITGESIGGTRIVLTGGRSINTAVIVPYTTGTVAITNDTKIVTLAGGVFPVGSVGMRIRLNQEYYEVLTRDSDTQVTLKYNYKGRTLTANAYSITDVYSGIQIQNLSVIGQNGAVVNTVPLIDLNNIHNGYAENLFISTTEEDCFVLNDCANFAINKCVAWNAGADTANQKSGFVITSDNVKITTCSGSNCKFAGIELSGESITLENSDFNNNDRYGIYAATPINSQYVIDSCTCDSNNLQGISTGVGVDSVSVTNSTISNTTSVGIYLMGSHNTITGNLFLNNSGAVRLASDSTLTANVFKSNTANVVHIEGTNVTVTGNTIDGGNNGMLVKNAFDCKFSKNSVVNCSDGIDITTSGSNNRFKDNDINNCVNGFRIEAAITGTILANNDVHTNTTDYNDLGTTSQYILDVPITAVQASALIVTNGSKVYVTTTDATFTSVGFWGVESGAWIKR